MNTSINRSSQDPAPPSDLMSIFIIALLAIAITLAAWLIVSTGTIGASAAPAAEQLPAVPYFPSQYQNQATEPSPPTPTF